MPGLTAAVEEEHRWRVRCPPDVPDQAQPFESLEGDGLDVHVAHRHTPALHGCDFAAPGERGAAPR